MATRPDLTMLQNINRKLRTGLWHIPVQWRALRRVPGWTYPSVPIRRIRVPHQHLYPLLFQRLPMLRLEGHRLGETAVESTGSSTSARSLTQRMVLRWHHLMSVKGISLPDAFEQLRWEFRAMLQNFQEHLVQSRSEAIERHSKLSIAKVKRDALHEELGRPARYAEHLEELVNRALHLQPSEPHQYFSVSMSRKLMKQLNKEQMRAGLTAKSIELQKQLDLSPLGRRSHEMVANRGGPAVPPSLAQADAMMQAENEARLAGIAKSATNSLVPPPHSPIQPIFPSTADRAAASIARASALNELNLLTGNAVDRHGAAREVYATPVSALSVVSDPTCPATTGEPIPRPELFFQKEREWATGIYNDKNSIGIKKDQRMTEFIRHLDRMSVEPDASLADYLAYVLYTQIRVLRSQKLLHWPPYTDYLNSKIYFQAFRLIQTGVTQSSVVMTGRRAGSKPILPPKDKFGPTSKFTIDGVEKTLAEICAVELRELESNYLSEKNKYNEDAILADKTPTDELSEEKRQAQWFAQRRLRRYQVAVADVYRNRGASLRDSGVVRASFLRPKVCDSTSRNLTFQEACTHQRLLTLIQSHLSASPMHSFRDDEAEPPAPPADDGYIKPRELPLTPLWQEIIDEKIRYKHPGESWYNSRIEETKNMESEVQEYDRIEREQMKLWAEERGKIISKANE